ncbi:hypothetical protein DFH09DRAFT_942654 [Mycena vulgaris]|nr:hypothetical protein DFH09DRAFT_942654 [Mycena vulgaris]
MEWSFGNATALALFGDPTMILKPVYETVEPYLRSLVLYDPPFLALGYPHPVPDGVYDPFKDPDCTTPDQLYENFKEWVSSYYEHPDISKGDRFGMSFEKRTEKRTISQWTENEKAKYCDTVSAVGSDLLAFAPPMQEILKMQSHKALFDVDLVAAHFPNVNVCYITGEKTCYYCMWTYIESSRLYKEAIRRGDTIRPTKFKLVADGNHFVGHNFLTPALGG